MAAYQEATRGQDPSTVLILDAALHLEVHASAGRGIRVLTAYIDATAWIAGSRPRARVLPRPPGVFAAVRAKI